MLLSLIDLLFLLQKVSTRFFRLTTKEAVTLQEAVQIRKEMSSMSMVDEFAKYAKLQRRLNQLTMDLEATGNFWKHFKRISIYFQVITDSILFLGDARKSVQTKIYRWTVGVLSVTIAVIYLSFLGYVGASTPVFIVPKFWFFPIQSILAYPSGIEGAISIPMWTLLTRNVISLVVKT